MFHINIFRFYFSGFLQQINAEEGIFQNSVTLKAPCLITFRLYIESKKSRLEFGNKINNSWMFEFNERLQNFDSLLK